MFRRRGAELSAECPSAPASYHKTMPAEVAPSSLDELSELFQDCGSAKKTVELGGNFTKRAMGGEIAQAGVVVSTRKLNRIIAYEPKDLTISVEAGIMFRELREALAANGQFLPLDPPFSENATIGGTVASNSSGPRRRRYGTARDMVIGMKFVTLEGNTVKSGGMVVKNVTGLDMGKLMIGSFGTLACMAIVNFKIFPKPNERLTCALSARSLDSALELRKEILSGVLQPNAIDLLNAEAVRLAGVHLPEGYSLLIEAAGNRATVERFEREFGELARQRAGTDFLVFEEEQANRCWQSVQELTSAALAAGPEMHVVRISAVPARIGAIVAAGSAGERSRPVLVRAGNGVGYVYCSGVDDARECLEAARSEGLAAVVEYAPVGQKNALEQWAAPGPGFEVMRRIKEDLDPDHLLNPGRLFNRL